MLIASSPLVGQRRAGIHIWPPLDYEVSRGGKTSRPSHFEKNKNKYSLPSLT